MNFTEKYNKHYKKNILLAKQVKLKKKNYLLKLILQLYIKFKYKSSL